MSEAQPTPGPWQLSEMNVNGLYMNDGSAAVMGANEERVALVDVHTKFKRGTAYKGKCEIRDANTRLIIAAPCLLRALQHVVDLYADGDIEASNHKVNPAVSAIMLDAADVLAKAKGTK